MKRNILFLLPKLFFYFLVIAGIAQSQSAQAQYCTTGLYTSGCTSNDGIQDFTTTGGVTNINHLATGCASGTAGYSDYTSISASQVQGLPLNFTITTLSTSWSQGFRIWVDWNDDGDFLDAGEFMWENTVVGTGPFTGTFTVPMTAAPGPKRMRVRGVYFTTGFTPCTSYTFGEVHDYTLTVISACPTMPVVTAAATPPTCLTDSLFLTSTSSIAGSSFSWTGPAGFTSTDQNPVLYPATAAMAGTYKVVVTEPTNGCVDSATVTVTLNPLPTSVTLSYSEDRDSVCLGASITVGATSPVGGITPFTYSWSSSPTGIPVLGTGSNLTFYPTDLGLNTLYLTLTNGYGCSAVFTTEYYVGESTTIYLVDSFCDRDLMIEPFWFDTDSDGVPETPIFSWGEDVGYTASYDEATGCYADIYMSLWPIFLDTVTLSDTICTSDLPYTWDGGTMTEAGIDTFITPGVRGCDSVTVMNLVVRPIDNDTVVVEICESELPYTWNGTIVTAGGEGVATTGGTNMYGCDSSSILTLIVHPEPVVNLSDTICAGSIYFFGGSTLSTTGVYTDTLSTSFGCDSVLILDLYVMPADTMVIDTVLCSGMSFDFFGTIVTDIGTNTYEFLDVDAACDTFWVLNITINDTIRTTGTDVICEGGSLLWGTTEITAAGDYDFYGVNADGCDTLHTLTISVTPASSTTTDDSVCAGGTYFFYGQSFNAAGTYTVTDSSGACDTIRILNLSITDTLRSYDTIELCAGGVELYDGLAMDSDSTYAFYGATTMGCDTVHYITIQMLPVPSDSLEMTICAGSSYEFYGLTISTEGVYSVLDSSGTCDTLRILELMVSDTIRTYDTQAICYGGAFTWGTDVLTTAGEYVYPGVNAAGCDTIHYLTLTVDDLVVDTVAASICAGATYTFRGFDFDTEGFHDVTDTVGCDTLFVINLSVADTIRTYDTQAICYGGAFTWGTDVLSTAGEYVYPGVNAAGCDTIHYLTLTVDDLVVDTVAASICAGATYTFRGFDFDTEGFHEVTDTVGCDTLFVINLSVADTIRTYDTQAICYGGSFTWGTDVLTTAGEYVYPGVNAAGCDTIHYLTLTVDDLVVDTVAASICAGATYTFRGFDFDTEGFHEVTDTVGCDTLFVINLSVADTIRTYDTQSICSGGSFEWASVSYTEAGVYELYGTTLEGCDTVHYLTIEVAPAITISITESFCSGGSFTFLDSVYTSSGVYTYSVSGTGCDTIYELTLTMNDTIRTYDTQSICSGASFEWAGVTYTDAGTYSLYGSTLDGCDTVHYLTLEVAPAITIPISESFCSGGSFTFLDSVYTSSGVYTYSVSGTGCDTIYELTLTMNDTIRTYDTQGICAGGSYSWAGESYTDAGTYPLYGTTLEGCDTIHYLTIEISPAINDTLVDSFCSGGSYEFFGSVYTTPGTYTYMSSGAGCDTLYVLNLSLTDTLRTYDTQAICLGGSYSYDGATYDAAGTYGIYGTTTDGCDLMHYLTITVNPIITDSSEVDICSGASVLFGGVSYSEPGIYTYIGSSGTCDTLYVLTLNIADTIRDTSVVNICAGGTIVVEGITLAAEGFYSYYYTTASGCDSIMVVEVQMDPVATDTTFAAICDNETYEFYGVVYEDYGIYSHLDTSGICDTLRVLNLGVSPTLESEITAVFCANSLPTTILGVDVPYGTPSTTNYATVLFSSVLGCDSTVTINLIVNDTSRTDLDTLVCFGTVFDFAGNTISEAGTYFDYQTNVAGCDSVIALHVMYTPSPSTEDTLIRECGSVVYNGETYYEDANFIDTFRDVIGCDSVWRNVQIEVLYEPKDTFYVEICEGESYDFNGDIYTSSTVATQSYIYHNGCDSMITMVLTVHPLPKISLSYTSLEPQQGDLLCVLDSVRLSAEGGENYMYFNEFNEFIGSGEFVDVILPTTQNLFYAVGFSEFGCSDTTRIMIEAQPCCDLLMPNAFTPNNDGLNDFFGPVTFGNPENYRLVIFNRYGDLVFESYKVNDKWDGYYKDGQKADAGTYFYVLTGTCYDGTPIQMKGDITLIR